MSNRRLTLSHSGGTAAAGITIDDECPMKLKDRLNGWRDIEASKSLRMGGDIHKAIDLSLAPADMSPSEFIDMLSDEELARPKMMYKEMVRNIYNTISRYVLDSEMDIVSNEEKLEGQLINPKTGEIEAGLEDVWLAGRADIRENLRIKDIIHEDGSIEYISSPDGVLYRNVLTDWKSCASLPDSMIQYMSQLVRYAYLLYLRGEIVEYVSIIAVSKQATPKLKRYITKIHPIDIIEAYEEIKRVAFCIMNNDFHKCSSSCRGKYHEDCMYYPLCFPHRFANTETVIRNNLKLEESTWEKVLKQ